MVYLLAGARQKWRARGAYASLVAYSVAAQRRLTCVHPGRQQVLHQRLGGGGGQGVATARARCQLLSRSRRLVLVIIHRGEHTPIHTLLAVQSYERLPRATEKKLRV